MKTTKTGTHTDCGFIPHYEHMGIDCPVKLIVDTSSVNATNGYQSPLVRSGRYVYALPDGGEIRHPLKISELH